MNPLTLISDYNGDPETIDVESLLVWFENKYKNINTRAQELSKFKRVLMEKTMIPGYKNGHEYNVFNKKRGKSVKLLGKLNLIKLNSEDGDKLKKIHKHESKIVNDFVISREIVEKLINLVNSKDTAELAIGLAICTGR
jgi:hypothetical protein